jgi:hypothetical protein
MIPPTEFVSFDRLGRAGPVGLRPTDWLRGHLRLCCEAGKTWISGTRPGKTTLFRITPRKAGDALCEWHMRSPYHAISAI